MKHVQSIITELMKQEKIKQIEIAQIANVNKSTISRFISRKTEIAFESMFAIANKFPNHKFEIMESYMQDVTLPENIKCSLEYASVNRMFDSLQVLIARAMNLDSPNPHENLQEWGEVYQYCYYFQSRVYTMDELLNKLNIIPSQLELRILILFLKLYVLYQKNKNEMLMEMTEEIQRKINLLDNGFIRTSYLMRLYETISVSSLFNEGDVERARKYAFEIIHHSDSEIYRAHSYQNLGMSYIFTDYAQALEYILEAEKIFNQIPNINKKNLTLNSTISFLKNVWNRHERVPNVEDPSEIAHYLVKNGREEEGLKILDQLEPTSFRHYYRWLGTRDIHHLYESIKLFKRNKNYFYFNGLIRPALIQAGFDPIAAELMCM